METTSGFNLNQNIRQWRDSLAQGATLRGEELDELEQHLRDSMGELGAGQLTEEERFLIATRRLGTGEVLMSEFTKLNPDRVWRSRLCWMLAGIFLMQVIGTLPSFSSQLLWRVAAPAGFNGHLLGFLAVVTRWIGFFAPFAGFLWLTIRKPSLITRWTTRASQHPTGTALWLMLVGLIAIALAFLPTFFVAARWGAPTPELMTRMQTMASWQMIGHSVLGIVVLPIALVWLARVPGTPKRR
jgi:hypothetical protein